jgi:hypothetical protein
MKRVAAAPNRCGDKPEGSASIDANPRMSQLDQFLP